MNKIAKVQFSNGNNTIFCFCYKEQEGCQKFTAQSPAVVPSGNSKYNLTEVSAFAGTGVTASDVNTIANAINRLSSRFLIGSLFLSPTIFFLSCIYELFSSICPIRTLNHFEFFMQKKHYKLDYRN